MLTWLELLLALESRGPSTFHFGVPCLGASAVQAWAAVFPKSRAGHETAGQSQKSSQQKKI